MTTRKVAAAVCFFFASIAPAVAQIPGAYGMWNDAAPSSSGPGAWNGAGPGTFRQKVKPQNVALYGQPKALLNGGGRPAIAPRNPQVVSYGGNYGRGSVVVDQSQKKLYYILGDGKA